MPKWNDARNAEKKNQQNGSYENHRVGAGR